MSGALRLLKDGQDASGVGHALPASGVLRLEIALPDPPPRRLLGATLHLAAADAQEVALALENRATDLGPAVPSPPAGPVRWISADLGAERVVTAIRLAGAAGAAHLKLFSEGAWRALPSPDPIAISAGPARTALGALSASKVMAELLAPHAIPDKDGNAGPEVLLPAPLPMPGIEIWGTRQPCHVGVSLGDDPPFFSAPGALPRTKIEVEGLLRALNRALSEAAPGTRSLELTLRAAPRPEGEAPAALILDGFTATPEPLPAGGAGAGGASGGAGGAEAPPDRWLPETVEPEAVLAQLCDATRLVAQRIEAPGEAAPIAAIRLRLRGAAGSAPAVGAIALHADADGRPQPRPIRGAEAMLPPLDDATPGGGGGWVDCAMPPGAAKPPGAVWAVCRLSAGEALWFLGRANRPEGFGGVLVRPAGGEWRDAGGGAGAWAQLQLRLPGR